MNVINIIFIRYCSLLLNYVFCYKIIGTLAFRGPAVLAVQRLHLAARCSLGKSGVKIAAVDCRAAAAQCSGDAAAVVAVYGSLVQRQCSQGAV